MNKEDILTMLSAMNSNNPKMNLLLSNLDFFEDICNYILSRGEITEPHMSGLTNLSIEESYDISKKVLDGINPRYSNIFNQYLSNGNIKVEDRSMFYMGDGSVSLNENEIKIRYGIHKDINDVYLIVHEFMHSLNAKNEKQKEREILTEGFAIFSEYKVLEYLKNNNILDEESSILPQMRNYAFYSRIKLLGEYIRTIRYINQHKEECVNLREAKESNIDKILETIQYSWGSILSNLLYGKYIKQEFNDDMYSNINENMGNETYYDLLFKNGLKIEDFIYGYEETIKLISSNKFSM